VTVFRLPQPFSFDLSTERFRAFGIDLANRWHEGGLHRVIAGREVRVQTAAGGVAVSPCDGAIEREVRYLLGEPFDLPAFERWATGDDVLAPIVARLRGFRPPLAPDPWEMLVGSISAQQVSLFAAFAVRNRFVERFGERHEQAWSFPRREAVARATDDELLGLGFSRRKAEYVLGLARSDVDLRGLAALPDEKVAARITSFRGLGEWTADWFLARHLARRHAWPAGDLGLRKAVSALYADGPPLTTEEVRALSSRFHPFENLSAHYLLLGARTP
jgi:DNA-3-methyladenine glycosylase II